MITNFLKFINENKYYNEILNPDFWNDDKEFNKRIEGKLMTIAFDFFDSLELETEVKDIQLTGSLANYNYTDKSDLDVHILIDFNDINYDDELVKKALDGQRFIWNTRHNITIKGHDVEVYLQDVKEPHTSSGLYSLMDSKWVVEPDYKEPKVDEKDVNKKVEFYKKEIDKLKDLTSKELELSEIDEYFEYSKKLKKKIQEERKEGLETDKAEFSVENLVFKELRNSGYLGELIDVVNDLYDKQFIQ